MNALFKLLLVAVFAYSGYYVYDTYIKEEPVAPPVEQTIKRTAPEFPSRLNKVGCPTCKGHGRLVSETGLNQAGYRCPICDGAGSRTLPAHITPCEHCKGMGKVSIARNKDGRITAQRCPLCQGSGLEKKYGTP